MDATLNNLRQALSELALPATAQLALFERPHQAASQLKRRYEMAHARADISRRTGLSSEQRQMLDEFLWDLIGHYAFEEGVGGESPVDSSTDEFLRESYFWANIRCRARAALLLLGWVEGSENC